MLKPTKRLKCLESNSQFHEVEGCFSRNSACAAGISSLGRLRISIDGTLPHDVNQSGWAGKRAFGGEIMAPSEQMAGTGIKSKLVVEEF
jgi:hypothetical protein